MTLTIHQPNFMPWYPFFQKMGQADVFVILQNCQYEKNGFQNRFNISNKWYTMSARKGKQPIMDKTYVEPAKDWHKIKTNLPQYSHILELFDECISENLPVTNVAIIKKIKDLLNIDTKIVFDFQTELKATDRLVELCDFYNAETYISGLSGKSYLELEKFKNENINVIFQEEEDMKKEPIIKILSEKINV
tara:strand:+ start:543 stop:1115 length:573 start_codon:yes stop_codon:yes gene_type:complete